MNPIWKKAAFSVKLVLIATFSAWVSSLNAQINEAQRVHLSESMTLKLPPAKQQDSLINEVRQEELLGQIKTILEDIQNRLHVRETRFKTDLLSWGELERFRNEVHFVFAMDPSALAVTPNFPEELRSSRLTERLQASWEQLKDGAKRISGLLTSPAWSSLEQQMKEVLDLRQSGLFQQARLAMKSGELPKRIQDVELEVERRWAKESVWLKIRYEDPSLPPLLERLKTLHSELQSFQIAVPQPDTRNPASFFQPHHAQPAAPSEGWLAAIVVLAMAAVILWVFPLPGRMDFATADAQSDSGIFSYDRWIQQYQGVMEQFQARSLQLNEQWANAKSKMALLSEARMGLQSAQTQEDFKKNLAKLNEAAPSLELLLDAPYFQRCSESQVDLLSCFLSLCDAVEHQQNIQVSPEKEGLSRALNQGVGNDTEKQTKFPTSDDSSSS